MKLIKPIAQTGRAHVLTAQEWGYGAGTDFWLIAATNGMLTAGNAHELSDYGWTTTALSLASATVGAADFIASADVGTPNHIVFDATGDLLQSPPMFGDYGHALVAGAFLGHTPTKLILEALAVFSVNSANETTSGFGLIEDNGVPSTALDHLAYIFSDGTNFGLRSGAASDAGALVDVLWHTWKIVVTSANVEWFIDGTSQGTIALEADEFPVSFGAHTLTTNRVLISWVHIWYE